MKYSRLSDVLLVREGTFNSSAMVGLLVSIPAPGEYSVSYRTEDHDFDVSLCGDQVLSVFNAIQSEEVFVPVTQNCVRTLSPRATASATVPATPSGSAVFTTFFRPSGSVFRSALFFFRVIHLIVEFGGHYRRRSSGHLFGVHDRDSDVSLGSLAPLLVESRISDHFISGWRFFERTLRRDPLHLCPPQLINP
jgi:hypothetical protein